MTEKKLKEHLADLQRLFKHAIKLYNIDLIKDPKERQAILFLEKDFQRYVNRTIKNPEGNALKTFLVFVANRHSYSPEERKRIGESLVKDLDKELFRHSSN